jgi:hypothetical protein
MTNDQIIAAIATALQTQDVNGEYANVVLLMQASIINSLSSMSPDQLANICTLLSINTSGS